MRKRSQRGQLRRVRLVAAHAMPLLREAGVISPEQDADTVMAWLSPSGDPRRIIARFPGGHRADLRIRVDGSFSMMQSFNLQVASE
ncbi:MAG: hypothetical protein ABIV36_24665 [Sphingobium limneticum]